MNSISSHGHTSHVIGLGRLEVYRGGDGRWWWHHIAANGRIDGASEQGYRSRWWARHKAHLAWPLRPVTYTKGRP